MTSSPTRVRPRSRPWRVLAAPVSLLAGCLAACGDAGGPRPIELERSYVPLQPPAIRAHDPWTRFHLQPPRSGEEASFAYDLPGGWLALQPSPPMREINLQVAGRADAECYLTVLAGGAGRVVENVNRWRAQMGLEPLAASAVEALPRRPLLGGPATWVELTGTFVGMGSEPRPDHMMVGLIRDLDAGTAVTLKMVGPAELVRDELARFEQLAASLRRESGDDGPPAHPPGSASEGQSRSLVWDVPEGWVAGGASSMREVTLHPQGNREAECAVFVFRRPAGGDEFGNLARWYGQMGRTLTRQDLAALPSIGVLGREAHLVELTGDYEAGMAMGGGSKPDYGMLAVFVEQPDQVVCVKLTGPRELVLAEKPRFVAFCQSLRASP